MQEFQIGQFYNPWLQPFDQESAIQISSEQKDSLSKPKEVDFLVKYKTEMCRNWEAGLCDFGDSCAFAHGFQELREKSQLPTNYRTKKCKQFYESGYCQYGIRCQFRHKDDVAHLSPSATDLTQKKRKGSDDSAKRRLKIFMEIECKSHS